MEFPFYGATVEKMLAEGKTVEQIATETDYPAHAVELTIKALAPP